MFSKGSTADFRHRSLFTALERSRVLPHTTCDDSQLKQDNKQHFVSSDMEFFLEKKDLPDTNF